MKIKDLLKKVFDCEKKMLKFDLELNLKQP
jgi:hypothetical protein